MPQAELDDLAERLRRTRWAEAETVDDWSQGIPLVVHAGAVRVLGRRLRLAGPGEAALNRFPQFRTEIDGLGLHFLHVRSPHEDALPLVISHGWPGSIVEFHKVIEPLTDPTAHGGDAADAFHVVAPSLPGLRLQRQADAHPGGACNRIADAFAAPHGPPRLRPLRARRAATGGR